MVRLSLGVLVASVFLATPAQAMLVYQRTGTRQIVAAQDDGTHARAIATGIQPIVSPSGQWVAFLAPRKVGAKLKVVSSAGGAPHLLWRHVPGCACGPPVPQLRPVWSPDSRYIVAVNDQNGYAHLFDVEKRAQREFAGFYGSGGFAPDSKRIAVGYDADGREQLGVYNIAHRAWRMIGEGDAPAWGPGGLVFVRDRGLMLKETLAASAHLIRGRQSATFLYPVDWSADGRTLLAAAGRTNEFALKALLIRPHGATAVELAPTFSEVNALSKRGRWVLGTSGGNVVATGRSGKLRVLARGAAYPSWTK
jgi:hypothetical protein